MLERRASLEKQRVGQVCHVREQGKFGMLENRESLAFLRVGQVQHVREQGKFGILETRESMSFQRVEYVCHVREQGKFGMLESRVSLACLRVGHVCHGREQGKFVIFESMASLNIGYCLGGFHYLRRQRIRVFKNFRQVNKVEKINCTRREGGVKKFQIFIYLECERSLTMVVGTRKTLGFRDKPESLPCFLHPWVENLKYAWQRVQGIK